MSKQVNLVYALTGLHNFIRQCSGIDDKFDTEGIERVKKKLSKISSYPIELLFLVQGRGAR